MSNEFYDKNYYKSIGNESGIAAGQVLPFLIEKLGNINYAVDFGCGTGAWLNQLSKLTKCKVKGLDFGDNSDALMIDKKDFFQYDFTTEMNLNEKFDLAISLEVAEHIPKKFSQKFVKNITSTSECVMFSAAIPGQGGVDHINEKELYEWQDIYKNFGYSCYDLLRDKVKSFDIAPWYKYNILVYAKDGSVAASKLQEFKVDGRVKNVDPISWKTRRAILRSLPISFVTTLAKVKHACRISYN